MKKILLTILFFSPLTVFAYTSPGSPAGFVNDFAGALSKDGKDSIERMLADYEEQTGSEISVAIIPELKDETIETYAVRLFSEWGIGKKGKDNGALFLISVKDRKMRIEVGYGLEGDLTDVEAKHIVANVAPPYFRNEDWDGGVRAGVVGMIAAVGTEIIPSGTSGQTGRSLGRGWGDYFWIIFFIPVWLGSVFARSRSWWAGGVVGAVAGIIIWLITGGWWWLPILAVVGLIFDYLVSTKYIDVFINGKHHNSVFPWILFMGGGRRKPWDKGGGFGGFGGGFSGGGGASGRW